MRNELGINLFQMISEAMVLSLCLDVCFQILAGAGVMIEAGFILYCGDNVDMFLVVLTLVSYSLAGVC